MPNIKREALSVTGVANTTTEYLVVESTEEEPKVIHAIHVNVSAQVGNRVEIWQEREKVADLYDYLLDTREASGTNQYKSIKKMQRIDLDIDLPIGEKIKIMMVSGSTATDLHGWVEYTIK